MSTDLPENQPAAVPASEPAADLEAMPAGLTSGAFLARLRQLHQLHREMNAVPPDPPMWGLVQFGSMIVGAVLGYTTAQSILDVAGRELLRPNVTAYLTIFLQEQPWAALGCASYFLTAPLTAESTANEWLLPAFFITGVLLGGLAPGFFLKQIRKSHSVKARQVLENALRVTVRNYPAEIEHSGGIHVLADAVELEALIHVLENKYPAGPATEKKT